MLFIFCVLVRQIVTCMTSSTLSKKLEARKNKRLKENGNMFFYRLIENV